ncbi:MAG: DUF3847 domain-containing protein [Clostridia bacterium]|nr:DUF3847 domain-containing protein [Clostridia bacterium]
MPKKKTIEELETEKARWEEKLKQIDHREARISNRIRHLYEVDRKKRTHHLCTRMGYIEHCIPALKDLTEPEFYDLFDTLLNLPEVREMIEKAVSNHTGEGGA